MKSLKPRPLAAEVHSELGHVLRRRQASAQSECWGHGYPSNGGAGLLSNPKTLKSDFVETGNGIDCEHKPFFDVFSRLQEKEPLVHHERDRRALPPRAPTFRKSSSSVMASVALAKPSSSSQDSRAHLPSDSCF